MNSLKFWLYGVGVLIHLSENKSYSNLDFYSFLWLFKSYELFKHVFLSDLWEKILPQMLQLCESSSLWTKSTGFLNRFTFFVKNFNSKLDTWMFLNPMKLSLYGDWFTFFDNSSWCSLGFYTFVWLIQSHELFQHVFLKHIY